MFAKIVSALIAPLGTALLLVLFGLALQAACVREVRTFVRAAVSRRVMTLSLRRGSRLRPPGGGEWYGVRELRPDSAARAAITDNRVCRQAAARGRRRDVLDFLRAEGWTPRCSMTTGGRLGNCATRFNCPPMLST